MTSFGLMMITADAMMILYSEDSDPEQEVVQEQPSSSRAKEKNKLLLSCGAVVLVLGRQGI